MDIRAIQCIFAMMWARHLSRSIDPESFRHSSRIPFIIIIQVGVLLLLHVFKICDSSSSSAPVLSLVPQYQLVHIFLLRKHANLLSVHKEHRSTKSFKFKNNKITVERSQPTESWTKVKYSPINRLVNKVSYFYDIENNLYTYQKLITN